MNLSCVRCGQGFESSNARGYCDECKVAFTEIRQGIHRKQRPAPGVCADGKFAATKDCPETVIDPVLDKSICGLCGSDEIEPGYGLGSGYGIGTYNFCTGCNSFLDFREDNDDE